MLDEWNATVRAGGGSIAMFQRKVEDFDWMNLLGNERLWKMWLKLGLKQGAPRKGQLLR